MKISHCIAVLIATLITACAIPIEDSTEAPATDLSSQFVGVWTLVHWESQVGDAESIYPFGENAGGRLIYDDAGHMAVQLLVPDRPKFGSPDFTEGTPAELEAAFEGYFAYYGSYSVDETAGTVTHDIEAALFPNWIGTQQVRTFAFDGDSLILKTPPTVAQGIEAIHALTWVRAN